MAPPSPPPISPSTSPDTCPENPTMEEDKCNRPTTVCCNAPCVPTNPDVPKLKPKLGTYEIDRTVGKGIFSVVKLATHTITGIQLAVKLIDKTRLDVENRRKVHRETEILKRLHHPNIVKLYQVMETTKLLCIVLEYLPNGEVFDYIANHGRFSEAEARVKFLDVLAALDYTHSCGMVHRDLKAENLLFDADMKIKLIDFSFGTRYSNTGSHSLLTTWCGSPPYAAPEIFKGEPYVGTKADIWSLGVVLYVLVCGTLPFDAQPLSHLKTQVLSASFRVPYWLSTACERLLRNMLAKVPSKRPTTREIYKHPWLTQPLPKLASLPPTRSGVGCAEPTAVATSMPPNPQPLSGTDNKVEPASGSTYCPFDIHTDLAADLELGKLNEFVILIMESYGMKRSQIFESLSRRAYDHLMATYLLLGEKIRRHRYSLNCVGSDLNTLCGSSTTLNHPTPTVQTTAEGRPPGQCLAKSSMVDSAVDMKSCICDTNPVPTSLQYNRKPVSHYYGKHEVAARRLPSSSTGDQPIPCCHWSARESLQSCVDQAHHSAYATAASSATDAGWCFDPCHQHFELPPAQHIRTDADESCLTESFDSHESLNLNQTDPESLPWLMGTEGATQHIESPQRRMLARRKYGVSNPPASLDQLSSTILASKDRPSDTMDCEMDDPQHEPHHRFSEGHRPTSMDNDPHFYIHAPNLANF